MVYLSSDHLSSLPSLSPISSYFPFHEDDYSILLTGLITCTCTPIVHWHPWAILMKPRHSSAKTLQWLKLTPEQIQSSPWSTRPIWSGSWPLLSLPVPLQPHWTLNCSHMQQVPSGPLHLLFHLLESVFPRYSNSSPSHTFFQLMIKSYGKKNPCLSS